MVMTALRNGASGGILKFFLMGLLVMATGGLVFMDMGGFFRGGITSTDVATVGKQTISITDFDRTVRGRLSRLGMTPQQAYELGYTKELLDNEIRTSLMLQKAADEGVRISHEQVAENIGKILAPMAAPGQKKSEVLQQLLLNQGMSEQQLANSIRSEMAVNLLDNAVQSGFIEASKALVYDMARYADETRDIEYVLFKNADYKGIVTPDDAALKTFYESVKEAYATPELRKSVIVLIDAEALKNSIAISDEEIREVYDDNVDQYKVEEMRNIEQAIISDKDKADAIIEKIEAGETLEAAVKAVTGNITDYLPTAAVKKGAVIEAIREDLFAAKKGALIGPVETPLGYQIVKVKAISPAKTLSYEDVKNNIQAELLEARILDAQYATADAVEDYLASGQDVGAITESLDVKTQMMPLTSMYGINEDGQPTFDAFGADAQNLSQSLFELNEGEASSMFEMEDGRLAAVYVSEIQPKAYKAYEDVKDELEKRWIQDQKRLENKAQLEAMIKDGGDLKAIAGKASLSVENYSKLKRNTENLEAPLTPQLIDAVFAAKPNTNIIVDMTEGAAIVKVTATQMPKEPSEDALKISKSALLQSQQSEAYQLYLNLLNQDYGVRVNDKLLDSVYGAVVE